MPFLKEEQFKGPVPGQGMTAEPQSRPWCNPPQLNTVEEATEFYVPRLIEPKAMDGLIDAMELEIPLTVLAETLTTGGVLQGLHTIDVATLVNPVIVELLKGIAENADIEYDLGDKLVTDDVPTPFALKRALADLEKGDMPQENMDKEELDMEEEPKGLMSRKQEMI